MDALSDILRTMRVRGSVYFCDQLKPPWELKFQDRATASFHLVRRGMCWVSCGDQRDCLEPGDLVFIEPGREHILSSNPPQQQVRTPKGETLLLCGYCEFSTDFTLPFNDLFPTYTIVRSEEFHKNPWLQGALDQLSAEYLSSKPGAELVINKLTEIVIVELIRISFGRAEKSHLLRALSDKQISLALQELHKNPQHPWTLDELAKRIGLSRAAFAKRFREMVGLTMYAYLTALRVQRASELLLETKLTPWQVANKVGYESDVAFTKTFKKIMRLTPTQYRKENAS